MRIASVVYTMRQNTLGKHLLLDFGYIKYLCTSGSIEGGLGVGGRTQDTLQLKGYPSYTAAKYLMSSTRYPYIKYLKKRY